MTEIKECENKIMKIENDAEIIDPDKCVKGKLYCMYNPMFETYGSDFYKLGKTFRELDKRLIDYCTSYLEPSKILMYVDVPDITLGENILFFELAKYRVNENREFFRCKLDIIQNKMNMIGNLFANMELNKIKHNFEITKESVKYTLIECHACMYDTIRPQDMKRHVNSEKHIKYLKKYLLKYSNENVIKSHVNFNAIHSIAEIPEVLHILNIFQTKTLCIILEKLDSKQNIILKQTVAPKICVEIEKVPTKIDKNKCKCGKQFTYRSGLSRHKNTCNMVQTVNVTDCTQSLSNIEQQLNSVKQLLTNIQQNT